MRLVVVGDLKLVSPQLLSLGWGPIEVHDTDGDIATSRHHDEGSSLRAARRARGGGRTLEIMSRAQDATGDYKAVERTLLLCARREAA